MAVRSRAAIALAVMLIAAKLAAEETMPAPPPSRTDKTVLFDDRDTGMTQAIERARETLPNFFEAFSHQSDNQTGFCLKVRFQSAGEIEHIWLADISFTNSMLEGTIGNQPRLPGLKFMQRVPFQITDVTDWMYIDNGYLVGGYTTMLALSRLSPRERTQMDAELPYKIRNGDKSH